MSDTIRVLGFEADTRAEVAILPVAYSDNTPILSAAFDLTGAVAAHDRRRILVVGSADCDAHGGAFTVTESATSGGSYAAATVSASAALTADGTQVISVKRNPAKPFFKVTFTGDNASASGLASAVVLFISDSI